MFVAWQLHRICDTLFFGQIMDQYHYYMHRSPNDGKDKEEKQIEIKTKTKNKTEGAELLKFTKSTQNELCFMEKDILNCLHKLDENKQTKAPYIDHNQITEMKQIYGKNGKYTQILITQYSEYDDDCLSDISLPPIPEQKTEQKQQIDLHKEMKQTIPIINAVLSDHCLDKNEQELDDKLHDESHEPTTIDRIQHNYDHLKDEEDESIKTKQSKNEKLKMIEDKTKSNGIWFRG